VKLGDDVAAYQAMGRAHELNRQDAGAADLLYRTTLGLARKSLTARQYPDALRYFGEAAKLRPGDPEPHSELAAIYTLTGHPAEAAAEQRLADGGR
jgi:Flp pilus assembly protein TadD